MSAAPSKLILTNQFGEESENVVSGAAQPLVPGNSNIVVFAGATAPVDGTTGDNFAAKGSLYIAIDTGVVYLNTGTITASVWEDFGTTTDAAVLATPLTGFVSGAGTISATDTILVGIDKLVGNTQNKTVLANVLTGFVAGAGVTASTDTVLQGFNKVAGSVADLTSETISGAGALSTTVPESLVNNATGGSYAVTLAAPSSQDGQLKVIKLGTATHTATLAMTNIVGPGFCTLSGTTTLTFTSTGDCAILMAVGAKWMLIGGSAIAS